MGARSTDAFTRSRPPAGPHQNGSLHKNPIRGRGAGAHRERHRKLTFLEGNRRACEWGLTNGAFGFENPAEGPSCSPKAAPLGRLFAVGRADGGSSLTGGCSSGEDCRRATSGRSVSYAVAGAPPLVDGNDREVSHCG